MSGATPAGAEGRFNTEGAGHDVAGNNGTGRKLVIVESPAKAKTIGGYLGADYVVESSIGHIRDLPQSAADVPAKIKGQPWARLGVDVENKFTPYYVVPRKRYRDPSQLTVGSLQPKGIHDEMNSTSF